MAKKPKSKALATKPSPKPLTPVYTSRFRSDVKRLEAGGKDMAKLRSLIETLAHRRPLEPRHKDHPLSGKWSRSRDCHVEPDWVLIYRRESGELILERTGSHSELFKWSLILWPALALFCGQPWRFPKWEKSRSEPAPARPCPVASTRLRLISRKRQDSRHRRKERESRLTVVPA